MSISWLKKISALLALCMTIGCLSACNGDKNTDSGEGTAEATSEAEQEEIIKVGYIFNGDCSLDSYSAQANRQRLGISAYTKVESCYIDNVSITDFPAAVDALVADGCTYIISGSWLYNNAVSNVAGKNMNINFVSHGARIRTVNVYAYTEQVYEGAYVAGMAAAFNSKTEKIGIVVDPDMLYSKPVINAAALGTQLVFENAQTVVAFASSTNEIHKAADALVAQNCDVIISYTESAETVDYCNSKGIKVIGCLDYSENASDYENMIMYFHVDHDSFYLAQSKLIQLGTWEPQAYVGDLSNGVVCVSDALEAAADGTQHIIDKLVPKIASGEAYIFSGELKNTADNVMVQRGSKLEPAEIYAMEWYVRGVQTLDSFIEPNIELENSEMVIKR